MVDNTPVVWLDLWRTTPATMMGVFAPMSESRGDGTVAATCK
jgi:hypothetical protein